MSSLELHKIKEIYQRFYWIFNFIGDYAIELLTVSLLAIIVANITFIFNFISNHKDKKTATLFFTTIIVLSLCIEIVLRIIGLNPGMHTWSSYFKQVEELKEYKGFYADKDGIFKIDSLTRITISDRIKNQNLNILENETHEVYTITEDYVEILNNKIDNSLTKKYHFIKQKTDNTWTSLDSAINKYAHNPINEDGFRSISFKEYKSQKPSVLLLGDSFTWGHTTENKTNSFADELLAKGYIVYNTGITGTDVAQYLAVAKKYIPLLKPDFVVVNFYLGNDITYYKREIKPYQPIFYCTNAGNLIACPQGKYFNAPQEAFNFLISQWTIPIEENMFNTIMAKTVISTLLWKVMHVSGLFPFLYSPNSYYNEADKRKFKMPYSNLELMEIKNIAEMNGSNFILSSLPEIYRFSEKRIKDFPDLFGGIEYVEMNVSKEDYSLNDAHFNDLGHKKYAEFLDGLIANY